MASSVQQGNRRQNPWVRLLSFMIVAAGSVIILIPLTWMLSTSLKTTGNVFSIPPEFIPREAALIEIEEKRFVLYDVTIDDETRTLAMVRLHPTKSEFFDPADPETRIYAPAANARKHRVVRLHWENYINIWTHELAPFSRYFANTVFYTLFNTIGAVLINSLVAFGFARLNAPRKDALFLIVLSTMMIPVYAIIIPQYILWGRELPNLLRNLFGIRVQLIDTYWPLILPSFFGSAYEIFLLRQFFSTIPRDYDDAARIDGASYRQIWWRVILPMSRPVLLTIAMIDIMFYWNEYFYPLIYLNSPNKLPLSVGLALFPSIATVSGPPPYHLIMAGSIISILPLAMIFFALNRYFIQGVVISGVKG